MTDIRADESTPLDDDDRLPWLEAVDEDEGGEGPSALKLIVDVLIGLVVIGAIVGGVFWMGNRDGQENSRRAADPGAGRRLQGPPRRSRRDGRRRRGRHRLRRQRGRRSEGLDRHQCRAGGPGHRGEAGARARSARTQGRPTGSSPEAGRARGGERPEHPARRFLEPGERQRGLEGLSSRFTYLAPAHSQRHDDDGQRSHILPASRLGRGRRQCLRTASCRRRDLPAGKLNSSRMCIELHRVKLIPEQRWGPGHPTRHCGKMMHSQALDLSRWAGAATPSS